MTDQPQTSPSPSAKSPGANIIGWLLVFLGGAWSLLSGGCTVMFMTSGGDSAGAFIFLAIGAVCMLPGLALLFGGWVVLRKPKPAK